MTRLNAKEIKRIIGKELYIASYFLFYHRKAVSKLSSYGFSDIKTYEVRRWVRIVRDKKLIRFYYKAQFKGIPCFIKLARMDITMKNEIFVNKYLVECGADFAPQMLISDENYSEDTSMIAFESISDLREFELPADENTFESICEEFEGIFKFFLKHGIIHGDINDSNLTLNRKNHIILIDFGLGKTPDSDTSLLSFSVQRGLYYQSTENTRIYDDAYSFVSMLDDCGISEAFKQKECYKRIKQLVGVHTHSINT